MSKKLNELKQKIDATVQLPLEKAIELVQSMKFRKFTESIDVAVRLGIDSRKSDQNVRGVSNLPNGIGKKIRVAVFADVTNTDEIIKAGALKVGMDDLVEDMKKGNLNYDRVIATPAAMKLVGKLGQLLGPKGLMPNPKTGSVTDDVKGAVEKAIMDNDGKVPKNLKESIKRNQVFRKKVRTLLGEALKRSKRK